MAGTLVVVVPALAGSLQPWKLLLERLKQEPALQSDTVWLAWEHRSGFLSRTRAESLALRLKAAIEAEWIKHDGFERVLLVGHSLGGLLVRRAYLLGLGTDPTVSPAHLWAEKVERLVLLAAINRGVNTLDPPKDRSWRRSLLFLNWMGRVFSVLQRFLVYDTLRGSAFVTNLRIQWMRTLAARESQPLVVQLLGDRDGLVDRNDSYDIEQFPTGWHVTVPETAHDELPLGLGLRHSVPLPTPLRLSNKTA